MTKRQREIFAQLQRLGAAHVETPQVTGGCHLCIRVQAANGVCRKFFASFTPGDHRADLNFVATVRLFCRQNSV